MRTVRVHGMPLVMAGKLGRFRVSEVFIRSCPQEYEKILSQVEIYSVRDVDEHTKEFLARGEQFHGIVNGTIPLYYVVVDTTITPAEHTWYLA